MASRSSIRRMIRRVAPARVSERDLRSFAEWLSSFGSVEPAAQRTGGRALRVSGDLHSFVEEIGRFTKAFGFHYDVSLDPPEIRHRAGRWVVRPGPYKGVFVVETRDGAKLYVAPFRVFLRDLSGAGYEAVELPDGRRVPAMKIHAEIQGAVAKYAVARFIQLG